MMPQGLDPAPGEFTGWAPEALAFLRELEDHNEREWFRANRARYDELLVGPVRALAATLTHLGEPKFFRPYNDQRFHARPPIKEQVSVALGYQGAGGWYLELSLDGLLLAAGLHEPDPRQVSRLREAVDDPRIAGALTRALRVAGQQGLELNPPDLKRAPRGYAADHPRADLLRRRRLTVARLEPLEPWLHSGRAGDRIRTTLDAAQPLVNWLRRHVGPPQDRPRR